MGRLPPCVADVRRAVLTCLADVPAGASVHAAVSGGDDSLALVGALAFLGPRQGWRTAALVVDHGWREGSAAWCAAVAARCGQVLDRAEVLTVAPSRTEDEARTLRYEALGEAPGEALGGAGTVLLGHTLDDQAETVLLALARGSGTRSLAGMAAARGPFRRPLLGLRRADVAAARAWMLPGDRWDDPANADPAFARVRVRSSALPALVAALGPGVVPALARTAALARDDADLLDALAAEALVRCSLAPAPAPAPADLSAPGPLSRSAAESYGVAALAAEPPALRRRVLHRAAAAAAGGAVGAVHVAALDALVVGWHGQGPVALPGGATAERRGPWVVMTPGSASVGL